MLTTNITSFRKNLFSLIENAISFNEHILISTKSGNAVMMSEEEYNSMIETLYISSVPGLKEKILEGGATPLSECIPESEVW